MIPKLRQKSWKGLLSKTRRHKRRIEKINRYDLRPLWRSTAFKEFSDQQPAVTRAKSFCNVLENCPICIDEDDVFTGTAESFFAEELPDEISENYYQKSLSYCDKRGERPFWAGFDHTVADYPELLKVGIGGLIKKIDLRLKSAHTEKEITFLQAGKISLKGFSGFIERHAEVCRQMGLFFQADLLQAVSNNPPENFMQSLQLIWLTQMAFVSESRYAMAFGRMDQYLWPFYENDIAEKRLTKAEALELLQHFWVKIEALGEITNICIGGVKPNGEDAVNELTYLMLDATKTVLSPHTNLSARFHDNSSDEYHRACYECIRTGVGFPAIFNDNTLINGLVKFGIPIEIARDCSFVGCIETMLSGRQAAWSDSRFNTPQYILSAINKLDKKPESYHGFIETVKAEIISAMNEHTKSVNGVISEYSPEKFPDPFLSVLTKDCIERARDINDGGAQFPRFHGIAFMGTANAADSLTAIKQLVFDNASISWQELKKALETDFEDQEPLRQKLINHAPKYGNDIEAADESAKWLIGFISKLCLKYKTVDGGQFVPCLAANVQNISAGLEIGATADGRKAHSPLSDAASPNFGQDKNGPTAFLASVSKPDYSGALGGTVINFKLDPEHFSGEEGAIRFGAFTKFFVKDRIAQLQFNFTGNKVLKDALKNPEKHENLVVRVSGFSAYFTQLERKVQMDVIRRRAH